MARIRTYKHEIFTDSKTGRASGNGFKLFLGIISHADDYGVIRRDDAELKAKVLPYEPGTPEEVVGAALDGELIKLGLLQQFSVPSSDVPTDKYLFVTNFNKHQRVEKRGEPLISGWVKGDTPKSFLSRLEHSVNIPGMVTESSENTPAGRKEGSGEEGGDRKEAPEARTEPPLKVVQPRRQPEIDPDNPPEGLNEREYAVGVMERLAFTGDPGMIMTVAGAIKLLDKTEGVGSLAKASVILRKRAEEARTKGDKVNRWWFADGNWRLTSPVPVKRIDAIQAEADALGVTREEFLRRNGVKV